MRKTALLTALLLASAASVAMAQEAPNSHTLDEQLARVKAGKPAIPMASNAAAPATRTYAQAAPEKPEWPSTTKTYADMPTSAGDPNAAIQSQGGGAIPALPLKVKKTDNGMAYISGGVGDEEMAQLKSVAGDYNLQVLAAGTSGEYLSGITIRVLDSTDGQVLAASNVGPYFYTRLNPGTYKLELTSIRGTTEKATVTVPAEGAAKPIVRFPDRV